MEHIGLRFREVFVTRKTGLLEFQRGGIRKTFFFQDGGLLFAKTNVSEERLGEILFRTGKIPAEVHATLPKYSVPNHFIGESLVQKRIIAQRDLYDALLAQINAIASACFPFFDATFDFLPRDRFLDQEFELRISLPLVIERGIRAMEFHPALKTFLSERTPVPKGISSAPFLADDEKALWSLVDGRAPAGRLAATFGFPADKFWKTLYLFYCLDLVDWNPSAGAEGAARPEPPVRPAEPPFVRAPDRPVEAGGARPAAAPPSEPAGPAGSRAEKQVSALEEQILEALELHRKLSELDYFQILGVSRSADEAEVKKAYFKLARRFHPDLFTRSLDMATKAKIDEVFDQIAKAYRTLTSKEAKSLYIQKAAPPARPDDKDQTKSAEVRFRQAKTLFSQGRIEQAIHLLEEAVRIRSDKGDFYLLLGMAESRIPALSKKAERDFLRAIELEPWNAEPHVGLAMLYKREGLVARAKKEFERAVEADPAHAGAKRELGELGEGEPKKGLRGLFSRNPFGSKKK
jgi:tetratricopeptide (TPR) repeat protein